jgi:hypothetical protein
MTLIPFIIDMTLTLIPLIIDMTFSGFDCMSNTTHV